MRSSVWNGGNGKGENVCYCKKHFCIVAFYEYFKGKLIITNEKKKNQVVHNNKFFHLISIFTCRIKMTTIDLENKTTFTL